MTSPAGAVKFVDARGYTFFWPIKGVEFPSLWTAVADVYAGLLAFMAITGVFVLRGRTGLGGRGKWLVSAGVLVPVLFLAAERWL